MKRSISQIISVLMEKIKNSHSNDTAYDIGNPVINATYSLWDEVFLHDLSKRSENDTDGKGDPQRLPAIGFPVLSVGFAVTPKRNIGKAKVH